jgi:transposase
LSRPGPTPTTHRTDGLPTIFPNAAAIDISADQLVVAVPPKRDRQPVGGFRSFTPDREALVAGLLACGIDTLALESSGVYWIPLYELLEQHGSVPYLVNGGHVKTVAGRKRDWNDAQWLQKLQALGLVPASGRNGAEISALGTLMRYRAELIQHRAPQSLHMQPALHQINIQLKRLRSDIMGLVRPGGIARDQR